MNELENLLGEFDHSSRPASLVVKEMIRTSPAFEKYRVLMKHFIPIKMAVVKISDCTSLEAAENSYLQFTEAVQCFANSVPKEEIENPWFCLSLLYPESFHSFRYHLLKIDSPDCIRPVLTKCWKTLVTEVQMDAMYLLPGCNIFRTNNETTLQERVTRLTYSVLPFVEENGGFSWRTYWRINLCVGDFGSFVPLHPEAKEMVFTLEGFVDRENLNQFLVLFQDWILLLSKTESRTVNERNLNNVHSVNRNPKRKRCAFISFSNVLIGFGFNLYTIFGEKETFNSLERFILHHKNNILNCNQDFVFCMSLLCCLEHLWNKGVPDAEYFDPLDPKSWLFCYRINQGNGCNCCLNQRWWNNETKWNDFMKKDFIFNKYLKVIELVYSDLPQPPINVVVPCFVCNYEGQMDFVFSESEGEKKLADFEMNRTFWTNGPVKHPYHAFEDRHAKRVRFPVSMIAHA